MRDNRRMRAGSGIYRCSDCGKLTRETGNSESLLGDGVCRSCYDEAGLENEHQDGYHDATEENRKNGFGFNEDCPMCTGRV